MEWTPGVVGIVVVAVVATVAVILWSRRHEAAAPVDAPHRPARSSHTPAAQGDRETQQLVGWLLDRASEQTGIRLADDALVRQRMNEAAGKAMESLRAGGSASINLPFLAADARGPKHFAIEFRRNADSTFQAEG
jgi:hypothetical protein